jgi:hypothetical protein
VRSARTNKLDLKKLQLAHQILTRVIDQLVETDDLEIDVDFESVIDDDGTPPSSDHGVQTFVLDSVLSSIG